MDSNGFQMVSFRSSMAEQLSRPALKDSKLLRAYQKEATLVVKELLGAKYAVPVQSTSRTADRSSYMTAYSKFAHCDVGDSFLLPQPKDGPPMLVTAKNLMRFYKPQMMQINGTSAPQSEIDEGLDYALVNIWQPMRHAAVRQPLALLDHASLEAADRVCLHSLSERRTPDNARESAAVKDTPVLQISQVLHNPWHRWYHYPEMQPGEAVVFKQIDSRPGRALCCFHTSVANPHAPPAAPERESVETRILCAFPKPAAPPKSGL